MGLIPCRPCAAMDTGCIFVIVAAILYQGGSSVALFSFLQFYIISPPSTVFPGRWQEWYRCITYDWPFSSHLLSVHWADRSPFTNLHPLQSKQETNWLGSSVSTLVSLWVLGGKTKVWRCAEMCCLGHKGTNKLHLHFRSHRPKREAWVRPRGLG